MGLCSYRTPEIFGFMSVLCIGLKQTATTTRANPKHLAKVKPKSPAAFLNWGRVKSSKNECNKHATLRGFIVHLCKLLNSLGYISVVYLVDISTAGSLCLSWLWFQTCFMFNCIGDSEPNLSGDWNQPATWQRNGISLSVVWTSLEGGMETMFFFQKIVHELVSLYSQFLAGSGNP